MHGLAYVVVGYTCVLLSYTLKHLIEHFDIECIHWPPDSNVGPLPGDGCQINVGAIVYKC